MPDHDSRVAHITTQTPLIPAINAWQIYLNDQGKSNYTVKAFLSDVRILTQYFAPDRSIGSISTTDLNNYLRWMEHERGVPCSPKTLARRITSLKSFFRWLNQHGRILADPAEKVVQRSVLSPLPQVLTEGEREAVLLAADRLRRKAKPDARSYTLLALLLTTGIKKRECLGIHLNHIDLEAADGPTLFIRYGDARNRYKERKLPLTEDWVAAYHEYASQYPVVDQLFPWSPRRLEYLLEDIGEAAGLGTKHLSFDMCRWTYAVFEYARGEEHERIRQSLGVSKIQWREISMKLRQLAGARG